MLLNFLFVALTFNILPPKAAPTKNILDYPSTVAIMIVTFSIRDIHLFFLVVSFDCSHAAVSTNVISLALSVYIYFVVVQTQVKKAEDEVEEVETVKKPREFPYSNNFTGN